MAEKLYRANVLVCKGTGCTASGAEPLFKALQAEVARRGLMKCGWWRRAAAAFAPWAR
jgi:hypothetical protein